MSRTACSRGCFICRNRGDGPATGTNSHSSECCGSTMCNSYRWNNQVRNWLKAETRWSQDVAKWLLAEMLHVSLAKWLLAEMLNSQQGLDVWLAAEASYRQDCELWLQAQSEFRATLRSRAVRRVRVQAEPATPQTAKIKAHAR